MAQDENGAKSSTVNGDIAMKDDEIEVSEGATAAQVPDEDVDMDGDEEEEEDPFLKFQNVMTAINFEKLKKQAVEIRLLQPLPEKFDRATLSCKILEPPLHGSYNIVYVIEFSNSEKWVARFPIQGTRVEEADIDMMNTDYSTLKYIRKELGIPTPEIFAWETTCDKVGVPFALMSFVVGESICHRWDDKEWITEEKRLKILTNLVHVMSRLQQPRFNKMGTLRFDDRGGIASIGPDHTRVEDPERYYTEGILYTKSMGPYNTVDDWLLDDPDMFEDVPDSALWQVGCLVVLKLALKSIPSYLRKSDRFELDFWDYNYQNILIDDDCNITTIYDWDGVRTAPQGMGATRYPSWITRDWDPAQYNIPQDGDWAEAGEDPPEKLTRYRKHYADTFASLGLKDYDPRETRLSHILEAISIGMSERFQRQYIMRVLLCHAFGKEEDLPWDYSEIVQTLMLPNTPAAKAMMKKISKQFRTMWHAEWEIPEPVKSKRQSLGARRLLPRRRAAKQANTTEQSTAEDKEERPQSRGRIISEYFTSKLGKLKR